MTFPTMLFAEVNLLKLNCRFLKHYFYNSIRIVPIIHSFVFITADCQEPWVRPGSSVACYASGGEKGMNWNDAVKV